MKLIYYFICFDTSITAAKRRKNTYELCKTSTYLPPMAPPSWDGPLLTENLLLILSEWAINLLFSKAHIISCFARTCRKYCSWKRYWRKLISQSSKPSKTKNCSKEYAKKTPYWIWAPSWIFEKKLFHKSYLFGQFIRQNKFFDKKTICIALNLLDIII
jgi:hypothetical protein